MKLKSLYTKDAVGRIVRKNTRKQEDKIIYVKGRKNKGENLTDNMKIMSYSWMQLKGRRKITIKGMQQYEIMSEYKM